MLLFDKDFVLVGMSDSTLNILGYHSFDSFKILNNNMSKLILDEFGNHAYNYKKYILDLIESKQAIKFYPKTQNNKVLELEGEFKKFYYKDDILYSFIVKEEKLQSKKDIVKNKTLKFGVFEKSNKQQTIQKTQNDNLDNEWFEYTAKKLSLSFDDFSDKLKNLTDNAFEENELLFESLVLGDIEKSRQILLKIRKSAYLYDIKPLMQAIYRLENSKNSEISANFREYKDIIIKINKIIERKTNEAKYNLGT